MRHIRILSILLLSFLPLASLLAQESAMEHQPHYKLLTWGPSAERTATISCLLALVLTTTE